MGIGDMMGIISFFIGVLIAYPALLIVLSIMFVGRTSKAAHRIDRGFRLPFIVGAVVAAISVFLVVALLSAGGQLQLIGAILFLIFSFWGTLGIAGMAQVFGARISAMGARERSPLYEMVSGGAVLTFAFAFPFLGWFVVLPIATVIGLGAATLSIFTRLPADKSGDAGSTGDEEETLLWQG